MLEVKLNISEKGDFQEDELSSMIDRIADHVGESRTSPSLRQLATVMIEMVQNINEYTESDPDWDNSILVSYDKEGHKSFLSENLVTQGNRESIEKVLKKIKNMNKEELQKEYEEVLRSPGTENNKSNGLGLLYIADKADKLSYSFAPYNSELFIFKLGVVF